MSPALARSTDADQPVAAQRVRRKEATLSSAVVAKLERHFRLAEELVESSKLVRPVIQLVEEEVRANPNPVADEVEAVDRGVIEVGVEDRDEYLVLRPLVGSKEVAEITGGDSDLAVLLRKPSHRPTTASRRSFFRQGLVETTGSARSLPVRSRRPASP
jgi:hypothetical protein